jgi:hypothetical protein
MKFRGFYCSDELYTAMQHIAISLNESDSEYIRKAVAYYNLVNSAQNVVLDSTPTVESVTEKAVSKIDFGTRKQPEFKSFPKGGGKK